MAKSSREREFFRYYQPAKSLPSEERDFAYSGYDPALLAFAQVGALRLNATRCAISLIGNNSEHILAEAGKMIVNYDALAKDEADAAWHSEAMLKDRAELCRWSIDLLCGIAQQPALQHVEVNLLEHERWKSLTSLEKAPFSRSYISFPLRTGRGYVIGTYSILDDKPRTPLESADIKFLEHMASTSMNHIEAGRVKQSHDRSEKMVRALALFLEGGESLRDWWLTQATDGRNIQQSVVNERSRRGISLNQQADAEFGVQDGPDKFLHATMQRLGDSRGSRNSGVGLDTGDMSNDGIEPSSGGRRGITSAESTIVPSKPALKARSTASDSQSETTQATSIGSNMAAIAPSRGFSLDTTSTHSDPVSGKELQEALLSDDVKKAFSRASNLLREALDLDGVVFFDASIGSFGGRSSKSGMNQKAPGRHNPDLPISTTSESDVGMQKHRTIVSNDGDDNESPASLLAYSTRSRSSLKSHAHFDKLGVCPESLLRALTKRYPHGKVFNFEDDGSISCSDIDGQSDTKPAELSTEAETRKAKISLNRRSEAAAVLTIVPGARSVVWFPLWDAGSERWYSGAFIWSLHPTRVLTPGEDITYMAAWGNSIMSEVSRLSALVASHMKVDFVASISHELRSPLHGILASVEFLQDEGLSGMQAEMVTTINSCGRTLLDTINHVLEFSKISKKKTPKKSKHMSGKRAHARGDVRASNISVMTEEVIDSVYAGRSLIKPPDLNRILQAPVVVIVDIMWQPNWNLKIDVGAYRRVLMNLFSNALKYTEEGLVKVFLTLEHRSPPPDGKSLPYLNLTITDSGRGISRDFLRDHLYTAFKQEDALSIGTGLGLSIVRQILHDIKGTINIKSELGVGTKAIVSIPVRVQTREPTDDVDMVSEIRTAIKDLKVGLVQQDFLIYPNVSDVPTGILSPEAESMISLKSSVESMFSEWFEVNIEPSPALDLDFADMILTIGGEDLEEKIQSAETSRSEPASCSIIIVICGPSYRVNDFTTAGGIKVYYLRLPLSPHKLANVLYEACCNALPSSDNVDPPMRPSQSPVKPALVHNSSTAQNVSPAKMIQQELPRRRSSNIKQIPSVSFEDSEDLPLKSLDLPQKVWTVLLVEDNPINLKLLIMYMKKLGHEYVAATNGNEALDAYRTAQGKFNIIFMDIHMPYMDGLESTREIRRYEHDAGLLPVAVVALTGAASASARQEAFSSGMDLYLTKPVAMKLLKEILQELGTNGRKGLREFT